jgi:hypothetical protein
LKNIKRSNLRAKVGAAPYHFAGHLKKSKYINLTPPQTISTKKMKAILEFDLPEERSEFELATKASDLSLVLYDMNNVFRSHLKYDNNPEWHSETVEKIKEEFYRILEEYNLNHLLY